MGQNMVLVVLGASGNLAAKKLVRLVRMKVNVLSV